MASGQNSMTLRDVEQVEASSSVDRRMRDAMQARQDSILVKLDRIGGGEGTAGPNTVLIHHHDPHNKVSVPQGWTHETAMSAISKDALALQQTTDFSHPLPYRRDEVLVAIARVMQRELGTNATGETIRSFFGDTKPQMMSVQTGIDDTGRPIRESVPDGLFSIAILDDAQFIVYPDTDGVERTVTAYIQVTTKLMMKNKVMGFLALVEEELRQRSIYRGQTLAYQPTDDGSYELRFVARSVDPTITYTEHTGRRLETTMFGPIRSWNLLKSGRLDPEFRVLLYGALGNGKTEACRTASVLAKDHGIGTIEYTPTSKDTITDLVRVFRVAERYGPCIIYIEDFDKFYAGTLSASDQSTLTNLFDGSNKGSGVCVLMTTNDIDAIDPKMTRAPRITGAIQIEPLNREAMENLLKVTLGDQLADGVDFDAIWAATGEGWTPAFLRSAYEQAKRVSAQDHGQIGLPLDTDALLGAIGDLGGQRDLHERITAARIKTGPTFMDYATDAVKEIFKKALPDFAFKSGGSVFQLEHNKK